MLLLNGCPYSFNVPAQSNNEVKLTHIINFVGHQQKVKNQIRRRRTQHLIRFYTVSLQNVLLNVYEIVNYHLTTLYCSFEMDSSN